MEGDSIFFTIGSKVMRKNEEIITMDTAVVLKDGRTFVPIRYVAESLNLTLELDAAENCINLISEFPNSFEFSLLQSMPKEKNYVLSPLSLEMALVMAANGANGETQREILDVLGIVDLEQFNKSSKDFIANSNKNEEVVFNIANSIWHNSDFYKDNELDFSDTYKGIIKECFLGTANKINNANGAKTVNNWISKETKDKIRNVITDEIVKDCLSFLVNTIYFKGDWDVPFAAEATMDDSFTDRNGNRKTTAFMNYWANYGYYENDDFQMLAKPYKDNRIQMYFILPKSEKVLTKNAFETAIARMEIEYVRFSLPKFKTEYLHKNLIDILKSMGIQTAFDQDEADFLNMYSKKPINNIYVNSILQKTFIEVNEKGTEAAAATAIMAGGGGGIPSDVFDFKCDRPFTYFIRNDATGDILFVGEYAFVE
jgi:serpin B